MKPQLHLPAGSNTYTSTLLCDFIFDSSTSMKDTALFPLSSGLQPCSLASSLQSQRHTADINTTHARAVITCTSRTPSCVIIDLSVQRAGTGRSYMECADECIFTISYKSMHPSCRGHSTPTSMVQGLRYLMIAGVRQIYLHDSRRFSSASEATVGWRPTGETLINTRERLSNQHICAVAASVYETVPPS